jgi:hypothetical protein
MRTLCFGRPAIALALLASGCMPLGPEPTATSPERPGVALLLRGSAFETASAREDARRLVGEVTARTVQEIGEEPAVDRVAKEAAGRFDASVARAARADARDSSCRKRARSIATAVSERAEVIVRIQLASRTTTRPATEAEREDLGRRPGIAGMLGRAGDTLHETVLEGYVERTTFPGATATVRRQIRWRDRRLGTPIEAPAPRVGDALAPAFEELPAPASARWDAVARALVTGGCPVLGDAVAQTFIADEPTKRRIHAAALGVLQAVSVKDDENGMSVESASPKPVEMKPSPTCEPPADVAAR